MACVKDFIKVLEPKASNKERSHNLYPEETACSDSQEETNDDPLEGLSWLFPDRPKNNHGSAGWRFQYRSQCFGWMMFELVDPDDHQTFELFAHHLWNASIWMASTIEECMFPSIFNNGQIIHVKEKSVLELGAGAGLAGIMAAKSGAKNVTITDYPDPRILETISKNVATNVPQAKGQNQVEVVGLEWGALDTDFAKNRQHSFDIILAADCLWIFDQHEAFIDTILWFLNEDPSSMLAISAGFHKPKRSEGKSGRTIVEEFFRLCERKGLRLTHSWERHEDGYVQDHERGSDWTEFEDRWTVCAFLQRDFELPTDSSEIHETT